MPDATDADLVRCAQGGDVDAIGELYDRHHISIFRYLWSRLYDRQLAEDLTGEVFTRMVTYLSGYRLTGVPFRAWLYQIAHNLLVDHCRVQGLHPWVSLEHAEGVHAAVPDPALLVERQLTAQQVGKALGTIDPVQQEVVVLRFLAGLSLQEVAAVLNKTVAAVKSLQHRGLAALRVALEKG